MAGRPGQIPAQLVGHALFYFTHEGDIVFDPMAGGGVVSHMCLAFGTKCCSFDLADHPETRPEIEPFQWNPERLVWPVNGNKKPDLIAGLDFFIFFTYHIASIRLIITSLL